MPNADIQEKLKHISGDCIAVRLRLLNRVVTGIYNKALHPYHIKASQLNILVAVATYGPVTVQKLGRMLHMDPSTLCRGIARMKNKDWLLTAPSGEGKVRYITTSKAGLEVVQASYPAWEGAQRAVAALLGEGAVAALLAAGDRQLLAGVMES